MAFWPAKSSKFYPEYMQKSSTYLFQNHVQCTYVQKSTSLRVQKYWPLLNSIWKSALGCNLPLK